MLGSFHTVWGWVTVGCDLVAGLYGVGLRGVIAVAIGASLVQVIVGAILYGSGMRPGGFHVFYGALTAISLAFAYVYRAELNRKSPALRWGIFALFLMGLGLRAIMTFSG
jgi:hypothetical protein